MPRNAQRPTGNRTDLLTPKPAIETPGQPNGQPITVPTGLPYGENQALASAQAAVPLPSAQTPQAPPNPAGGAPMDLTSALQAAQQMQKPDLPNFSRGTERPNEPVTAGLPGSPVTPGQGRQVGSLSSMLSQVSQATNNPALTQLAQRAASAGQ